MFPAYFVNFNLTENCAETRGHQSSKKKLLADIYIENYPTNPLALFCALF